MSPEAEGVPGAGDHKKNGYIPAIWVMGVAMGYLVGSSVMDMAHDKCTVGRQVIETQQKYNALTQPEQLEAQRRYRSLYGREINIAETPLVPTNECESLDRVGLNSSIAGIVPAIRLFTEMYLLKKSG